MNNLIKCLLIGSTLAIATSAIATTTDFRPRPPSSDKSFSQLYEGCKKELGSTQNALTECQTKLNNRPESCQETECLKDFEDLQFPVTECVKECPTIAFETCTAEKNSLKGWHEKQIDKLQAQASNWLYQFSLTTKAYSLGVLESLAPNNFKPDLSELFKASLEHAALSFCKFAAYDAFTTWTATDEDTNQVISQDLLDLGIEALVMRAKEIDDFEKTTEATNALKTAFEKGLNDLNK